jgi:glycosyltransferase domain protein
MTSIYPGPERDYTVLVRCFTFNQSKYIEDALNGFVMQQTTFPFVCLVVDDASTDGEPEVIKSWMERECDMADAKHLDIPTADIIIVPHKTNLNCTMAVYLLKENLFRQKEKKMEHVVPWREHCRYEAMCEGDDYWIAPLKLQKQVNYLEAHPEVSYSCHRFNVLTQNTGEVTEDWNIFYKNPQNNNVSEFLFDSDYAFSKGWITLSLTQVVRCSALNSKPDMQFKYYRDVHNIYSILQKGKGVCHSFFGGVYRVNTESIYGGKSHTERLKIDYELYKEFYQKTGEQFAMRKMKYSYVKLVRMRAVKFPTNAFELNCWITAIFEKLRDFFTKRKSL